MLEVVMMLLLIACVFLAGFIEGVLWLAAMLWLGAWLDAL
jgi:hypothetical protein